MNLFRSPLDLHYLCKKTRKDITNMNNLYFPAEWERQSAIQLTWPHADTDWNEYLDEINKTYVKMADAITKHEGLIVVTPHPENVKKLLECKLTVGQMARVTIHQCPTNLGTRPRLHIPEGKRRSQPGWERRSDTP